MARADAELLLDGFEVKVSNPSKLYFPEAGLTKLDLIDYYLVVAEGALVGVRNRPMALKRWVDGQGEAFFQKRAPKRRPEFIHTVTLSFPSGRTADECVVAMRRPGVGREPRLHRPEPPPDARDDLEHPDELRDRSRPRPGGRIAHVKTSPRW